MRDFGYVTRVKDQGQCGSCSAFSGVGPLEGQYKRFTGKLVEFSEQNIVDCRDPGTTDCAGGMPWTTFSYAMEHGGLESAITYPYSLESISICKFNSDNVIQTGTDDKVEIKWLIKGVMRVDEVDEIVKAALSQIGPLTCSKFLFELIVIF